MNFDTDGLVFPPHLISSGPHTNTSCYYLFVEPENSDYVDLGLVDITDYEIADIKRVLAIKNTTKDKLAYTVRELMVG